MIAAALLAVSLGYWAPNHADINKDVITNGKPFDFKRSADIRTVDQYLKRVLYVSQGVDRPLKGVAFKGAGSQLAASDYRPPGTDLPTDTPDAFLTARQWNTWGGTWEDGFSDGSDAMLWGGLRAVNHFHNPLAFGEGGYTGIRTASGITVPPVPQTGRPVLDLLRKGMSVTTWVQGGNAEKNHWGYPAITSSMKRFFTDVLREKRPAGLAAALRAMGQVEHLIEDNTVPDHARDLAHPGNGFEEYLKANPALFGSTPQPWPLMPLKKIEEGGLRALWDRDAYTGTTPTVTLAEPVGIDEFAQANFLAWNRFYAPWWTGLSTVPIDFTTVPEKEGVGFPGLPWPKLSAPADGKFLNALPSLPLSPCIAKEGDLFRGNYIDAECWKAYALPLMKKAHGYAQTVFTLTLPPARAELVPAEPFDLRRWKLRVWNLGTGDNAVTWHVDTAKVMPIVPDGLPVTRIPAPITLPGVSGDIGPSMGGEPWESPPFALSILEQSDLNFISHSVVVLEGNLGTQTQTPIVFGIPIPSGLPLVKQETSTMTKAEPGSVQTTNTSACCNPMQCTPCGEQSEIRVPLKQKVTGKIQLLPSRLDLLGEPADAEVRAAQEHDARIAGVALIAYTTPMQRYYAPTLLTTHTLDVSGMTCAGSVCRRDKTAADAKQPELTFSVEIDGRELMNPMVPPISLESVYLVVWTTAGTIVEQTLLLWPLYHNRTAPQILADFNGECDGSLSRSLVGAETAGGCKSGLRMPTCSSSGTGHTSWTRWQVLGPIVGLGASIQDKDFFHLPAVPKIKTLAGIAAPAASLTCNPMGSIGPGNVDIVCVSDRNAFVIKQMTSTGSGPCPGIPAMPALNQTASYEMTVGPDAKPHYTKLYGHETFPVWTTNLD